MTAVTYTAKRSVLAGHSADSEYTIDLRLITCDPGKDVGKETSRSKSGNTETVIWRNQRTWSLTTGAVRGSERDLILEFLESVLGGETFQFDEFGSAQAPEDPVDVTMDGVYSQQRAIRKGGDSGRNDYFRYSFRIIEEP